VVGGLLPQGGSLRKGAAHTHDDWGAPGTEPSHVEVLEKIGRWTCLIQSNWRFAMGVVDLSFVPTGKTKGHGDMIQHSRASMLKASLFIAGGLAFFLVLMHQAAQLFR
jgi:hypothetical protein